MVTYKITVNRAHGDRRMTVDDDKCLVNVFNMYKSNREIHIFVDVANENREVDNMVASKNENRETDNVETRGINAESDVGNVETDVVNVQFEVGNGETDMGDNDKENDEYDFSYEDKNWRGDDDVPYSRNDCQYVGPISTCKEWDASSDGFSDYQSGNEGGRSSSDSDNVEIMNGDSKRKRKSKVYDTFEYETEFLVENGGNSDWNLCKGMFFENVDLFRDALRDYIIKKGIKVIRKKNERARVTVHCVVARCKWRIYASLLWIRLLLR
ncbi:unnamed protein product [Ilex paraguariensis]|uniref:Transposase MuDR plant domain-containing protein n=1 Tax=Ilex paraguariensis TaxID=185542 RepID=A0ABC8UI65_9AQUA